LNFWVFMKNKKEKMQTETELSSLLERTFAMEDELNGFLIEED